MDLILGQFLAGLSFGSTLFLVSAGLTLIFGVTRVVNFAHGALYMLGAYLAFTFTTALPATPFGFFGGVLLAAVVVGAAGVIVEFIVLRRIYAAPEIFQLLATFGVALIIQDLVLAIWGPEEQFAPRAPGLKGAIQIGSTFVPEYNLLMTLVGPLMFGVLWWLFHRTRWGTIVRAATQDREMASALGVNERLLFTAVFALGAALAGLAGALQIPRETVNLQMDLTILVEAFVVVVVGGLGSIAGAFWASLVIGVLHAFGIWLLPQSTLVLVFVVMAAVLIVRPYGLLGRPEVAHGQRQRHDTPAVSQGVGPRANPGRGIGCCVRRAAVVAGRLCTGDRHRDGYLGSLRGEPAVLQGQPAAWCPLGMRPTSALARTRLRCWPSRSERRLRWP